MGKRCGEGVGFAQPAHWFADFYHELRRLASTYLNWQQPGGALEASDLVHEAWLRLAASEQLWQSRAHFLSAAATAMRCVLIDQARRAAAVRHGGDWRQVPFTEKEPEGGSSEAHLLAIQETLDQFAAGHAAESALVKLRYYDGLTLREAADALGISHSAAKRSWTFSRAWLCREMQKGAGKAQSLRA